MSTTVAVSGPTYHILHGHTVFTSFEDKCPLLNHKVSLRMGSRIDVFHALFWRERFLKEGSDTNTPMPSWVKDNLLDQQILIIGHSHYPEMDLTKRFVNSGFIDLGYASYAVIDEDGPQVVRGRYQADQSSFCYNRAMQLGKLFFKPVEAHPDLVAEPTLNLVNELGLKNVDVSEIDDSLADTAAFCEHYDIGMDVSANCVIVEAKRGDTVRYAACMVLATTRADINGIVRRHLDARKISFAPMDTATSLTGMMYGGITPIGLPADWPIIIDTRVDATKKIIIGSGLRKSKILVPGNLLATLPNATVLDIVKE